MKNLNPIITIVLAVGLIILYFLHFSASKPATTEVGQTKTVKKVDTLLPGAPVAYINTDTLIESYDYAIALKEKVKSKTEELSNSLKHRYSKLEKEIKAFQDKVNRNGFLSNSTFEAAQKELQQKQLDLQQLELEMNNQIQEMQIDMQYELIDTLNTCIRHFNSDDRYQLVLNKTNLSNIVLYGDEGVNITDTIIKLLNKRYLDGLN